jgi:tetratricopeptide (TPR) repeat protein
LEWEFGLKRFLILAMVGLALSASAEQKPAQSGSKAGTKRAPATRETALPAELQKAEEAISRRDYATAEPLLLQEIKNNPQDFRAYYDLGFVYSATNRREQAIEAYKKALSIDDTLAQAHGALGSLLLSAGQPEEAITHLQRAAQLKPSFDAWMALAVAQEADHPQDALASFAKAASVDPTNAEPHLRAAAIAERLNDLATAEREYAAAQKVAPSKEAFAGLVNIYEKTDRCDELEPTLRQLIKLSPDNAQAHLQLAKVLQAKNDAEGARKEFEAAASIGSTDPVVLRQLAAELSKSGNHAQAIEILQKAVQSAPADAQLRLALASELVAARRYAEAEQQYQAAIKADPKLVEAYNGFALAASKNSQHELALRVLDARAKIAPENAGSYFLRATSYDHLQQYPLAAENYRRFLEVANGGYPDQEWQARHRLIAIEPEGKKKK